jgi:catechol 2,3-dioxygenase-like lactoylglutathione lyase family enzyme
VTDPRPRLWVGHVVLATHDLVRARAFYGSLGLRPVGELGPDDVLTELEMRGGTHLVCVFDPNARTNGRTAPFDLMVDDIDELHTMLSERGIEVSPIDSTEHVSFTFRDPDGYIVTVNATHVTGPV